MSRKTLVLFVLCTFILTVMVSSAIAGVSPRNKTDKLITGFEEDNWQFVHNAYYGPSQSPGETMGVTTYDYQHNGSMGRQVSWMPGTENLHFVWMKGQFPESDTARKIAYNARNFNTGGWSYGFGPAAGNIYPTGDLAEIGGYTNCDVRTDGGAVVTFHGGANEDLYSTRSAFDGNIPFGFFSWGSGLNPPNCEGISTGRYELNSKYIWPIVDWSDSSGTSIIQVVSCESQATGETENIQSVIYYRQEHNGAWGCGRFIDSVYSVSPVIRVDPTDHGHLALVYLRPIYYDNDPDDPCGWTQWQNDVVYKESFNYGKTWSDINNVTDYSVGHTVDISTLPNGTAYTDVSAMFDTGGKLHIVWNTAMRDVAGGAGCEPDDARSRIWHWDDDPGGCITIVYDAATPGRDNNPGAFNLSASKMNISECDDKFYVSFTRFGAEASGDYNLDFSDGGYANGEIFLTGSTNGGVTWGEAVNLTNSTSHDCVAGDCDSDHWSSMAMYSNDSVHIQYINDKDAGGTPQSEGEATENPVKYLHHECFTPAVYCAVGHIPTSVGYPMHIAPNDGSTGCTASTDTTFVILLTNTGNDDTHYTLSETSDWITILGVADADLYAGCQNTAEIEIQLGPVSDSGVYYADINLLTCGSVNETIPVQLYVQCEFFIPESKIISTDCWSVGVWNVPRAGTGQRDDHANMYWTDGDDESFMYDNGLIITYAGDHSNSTYSLFDGSDSDREFRALSPLDTLSTEDYQYAYGEFCTQDTAIIGQVEYWVPTGSDTCVLIERIKICNNSTAAITIHVGEGIDWDIPESGSNHGGTDDSRNMIYQYGVDEYADYYGGASICHNIPGAAVLQNDIWVYPNSGYYPDSIGDFLATHTGFVNMENPNPDSAEDLNCTYVIAQNVVLEVDSCYTFSKIKASSKTGLTDLQDLIDKGKEWALGHGIECGDGGVECVIGDANGSGAVDIDDVVYLIQYIFAGGPAPIPMDCCGDANGSGAIDIDDVVYLIQYIFAGGPVPDPTACDPPWLSD